MAAVHLPKKRFWIVFIGNDLHESIKLFFGGWPDLVLTFVLLILNCEFFGRAHLSLPESKG